MIRITGMNSGLDTEAIITELMSAYRTKGDKYVKEQTKLSWKQEKWKSLNSKIFSFYKKAGNMRYSSAYNLKKTTVSDTTKATVTASADAVNGTQTLKVKELAKSGKLTGAQLKETTGLGSNLTSFGFPEGQEATIRIKCNGKNTDIKVNSRTTIEDFVNQINESGADVKVSFDSDNKRIYFSSKVSGEDGDFTIEGLDDNAKLALEGLGLTEAAGAVKVKGTDAKIELDGVDYTSKNNTFTINGLTIQALAVTGDDELSVTTETDVDGIYDTIKEFLSEYNSLINEMTALYNADSAKDYEPLTNDEKDAMSDTDIEAWEEKIKSALLRRDGNLSSVMNSLTSALLSTTMTKVVNGKAEMFSLSSFGIKTLGYFESLSGERSALHIDGDPDDENTSELQDKLRAGLRDDPDFVIDLFKQFTSSIYQNLDKMMKSTELSSVYTVYNDKEMAQQYSDYTKTISAWEKKMQQIEDNYYNKFSKMETALAKLQSQTSALSGFFG